MTNDVPDVKNQHTAGTPRQMKMGTLPRSSKKNSIIYIVSILYFSFPDASALIVSVSCSSISMNTNRPLSGMDAYIV